MIKQEAIFKKTGFILEELNEQYQYLAQNAQHFSGLELDLFLANAKFLVDHIEIIKKITDNQLNKNSIASEKVEDDIQKIVLENLQEQAKNIPLALAEEAEFENEIPEIEIAKNENITPIFEEIEKEVFKLDNNSSTFEFILNDHAEHETNEELLQIENDQFVRDNFITNENKFNTDEKFEFEEKSVDEIFNRPLSGEEERIIAEKRRLSVESIREAYEQDDEEEEEVGPEPFLVVKEEVFPILEEDLTLQPAPSPPVFIQSDQLVEDPSNKPTLNELLAGKNNPNTTNVDKPLITDLKHGVNLNDKLLYIKDLFNGYNLAYAEAIEIANKLPNFDSADNFFQMNYAAKNNWALKQATVDKFYELLNQRFK